MRQVSENYRPFPVVRDVDCQISFGVIDQSAASAVITDSKEWGAVGDVYDSKDGIKEMGGKYASLEQNLWALDGTFSLMPNADEDAGVWSGAVSDGNGLFTVSPYIRYRFENSLSTLGWTLYFDSKANQYARRVRFTTFNKNGAVMEVWESAGDSPVQMHNHYSEGYWELLVEFLETSEPYRMVRLAEVDFGLTKYYDRNSLGEVQILYDADLFGNSLPSRQLSFTFDNSGKDYNLLDPDGVYQHLQEGQKITARFVIGGEAVDMGEFIFTKANVSKGAIVPEIIAHDAVYALSESYFDNGRAEDVTLSAAVAEVLGDMDIPVRYEGGSENRMVSMTVPDYMSRREALQAFAQAAMTSPYVDRDGVLVFADFAVSDVEDGQITKDELYDYSGVSISDPVKGVRLTVQDDYRPGKDGTPGRQANWYSGSTKIGDSIRLFSNPCVADSAGQAVADWLLARCRMRKHYDVMNRCNPAVEIGDTLRIDDIFGNQECGVVTNIEINYNGTLSASTKAVGA